MPHCQSFNVQKKIQKNMLRVLRNKVLQALKETLDDCQRKTFFYRTNFHRFHVHLFILYSTQLKYQIVCNPIIDTVLLHLLNKNHPLDTFHEPNTSDVENKTEMKFSKSSLKLNLILLLKLKISQTIVS